MQRLISQLVRWMHLFFTPTGRNREDLLSSQRRFPSPILSRTALAPTVRHCYEPLDGAGQVFVRPYLAAYEREEKARVQRLRRDILWCATYCVDLDTRGIHAHLGTAS